MWIMSQNNAHHHFCHDLAGNALCIYMREDTVHQFHNMWPKVTELPVHDDSLIYSPHFLLTGFLLERLSVLPRTCVEPGVGGFFVLPAPAATGLPVDCPALVDGAGFLPPFLPRCWGFVWPRAVWAFDHDCELPLTTEAGWFKVTDCTFASSNCTKISTNLHLSRAPLSPSKNAKNTSQHHHVSTLWNTFRHMPRQLSSIWGNFQLHIYQ